MASDLVHLRLGNKLIDGIDFVVKNTLFDTRTEFIKETLRKEVSEQKKKILIESLRRKPAEMKKLGIKIPSNEKLRKIREELGNELLKKYDLK